MRFVHDKSSLPLLSYYTHTWLACGVLLCCDFAKLTIISPLALCGSNTVLRGVGRIVWLARNTMLLPHKAKHVRLDGVSIVVLYVGLPSIPSTYSTKRTYPFPPTLFLHLQWVGLTRLWRQCMRMHCPPKSIIRMNG